MIGQKRRETLTDKKVAALPRGDKRYLFADPEQRGLYVRVMPKGPHVYAAVARNPLGTKVWATIGTSDVLNIEPARKRAREAIQRIKDGKPAFEPPPVTAASYQAVVKDWLEFHVKEEGLRSQPEIERLLNKFVLPEWGGRDFVSVRRRDVNDLLNAIVRKSGAWNADHVLAVIRKIANWYQTTDEDYESPFVVGMRRTKSEVRERERKLTDDELRRVWAAAEAGGTFGALVRALLLTAQRRGPVATMRWQDISDDGVWTIPTEAREKGNAGALKLPEVALKIIRSQQRLTGNPHVFAAARGVGPLNGFNKRKSAFDKACGVTGWTLHDCRRTARSLMAKAGVSDDHAEHALGHKLQGVRRVYNRHGYQDEKADALRRLAALSEIILAGAPTDNAVELRAQIDRKLAKAAPEVDNVAPPVPEADNVVPMRKRRRRAS
jgi:integrase